MNNLTTKRFGRLTVIKLSGVKRYSSPRNTQTKSYWLCKCECGNEKVIRGEHLTSHRTVSCGCAAKNNAATHGLSYTPEYKAWQHMRQRIMSPDELHKKYYGDVDITESWDNFENFLKDMGPKPTLRHELDRIDPFQPYCKENCRWATRSEQMQNQRRQYA